MMKLCEMKLIGHADIAKNVKFTFIGSHVCDSVCKKCSVNIKQQNKEKNLKIIVLESYCELIDKEIEHITNLATQCVCVYRIQNYKSQSVIMFKFKVNPQGLVKIQSN